MNKDTIRIEGILLTGRSAVVIPCLAFIGVASIATTVGIGVYKLGQKMCEKTLTETKTNCLPNN